MRSEEISGDWISLSLPLMELWLMDLLQSHPCDYQLTKLDDSLWTLIDTIIGCPSILE
jgi:hypothetical protein